MNNRFLLFTLLMIMANVALAGAGINIPDIGPVGHAIYIVVMLILYVMSFVFPFFVFGTLAFIVIGFFVSREPKANSSSKGKTEPTTPCPACSGPVMWGDRECARCQYEFSDEEISVFVIALSKKSS